MQMAQATGIDQRVVHAMQHLFTDARKFTNRFAADLLKPIPPGPFDRKGDVGHQILDAVHDATNAERLSMLGIGAGLELHDNAGDDNPWLPYLELVLKGVSQLTRNVAVSEGYLRGMYAAGNAPTPVQDVGHMIDYGWESSAALIDTIDKALEALDVLSKPGQGRGTTPPPLRPIPMPAPGR